MIKKLSPVNFDNYKAELKRHFVTNPDFADYNFEASGLATILNILAYNAHNLGAHMWMLNNESSIDTAQTKQSIYSKARGLGYTPKMTKSAIVEVVVQQTLDDFPIDGYVVIHAGKQITGVSSRSSEVRTFINIDDIYLYNYKYENGKWVFSSDNVILYEGKQRSWEFIVDNSVLYQNFIIKDKTMDIDTLKVFVKASDDDIGVQYNLATSAFSVEPESPVFYTTVTQDGFYQIHFGNNILGRQPEDGMIIHCDYIASNGELGNGCNTFTLAGFEIIPTETSNSGSDGESLENTRFNAVHSYKRQNRLLTPDDYKSAILEYFRNIQSINIWRGEDHYEKRYGKIFISIKPNYADRLSASAKKLIETKLLDNAKMIGAEPIFTDPEFLECDIDIILDTDYNKNSVSINTINDCAIQAVNEYNKDFLNVFDSTLSEVELNDRIRKSHIDINSSYTRKTLTKTKTVRLDDTGEIDFFFGNAIQPLSINFILKIGEYEWNLYDMDGVIIAETTNMKHQIVKNVGKVDYKTGNVKFSLPNNTDGKMSISVSVIPKNPDIRSVFNNIIRIARVRVVDE